MNFDESYELLNNSQKQAVEALDGPVLVIAGPGTGKTQLLSMRVANILRKTDTDARNILCLTFTNLASVNMRERLNSLTAGEGRDVSIKTFHAFAADIMNSYPEKFWNGANLQSAPDGVQLKILQEIFEQLPKDSPYASIFDGHFTQLNKANEAIKLTKEAGLTPEKLKAILQFNLAYIDTIELQMVDALEPTLSYKKIPELVLEISKLPTQNIDSTLAPLLELATVIQEGLDFAVKADDGTNKTKNVGEWKKRWVQKVGDKKGMHKIRKACNKWLELAEIYGTYREKLHRQGFYDYSDMLLEVIVQLEKDPELLSDIQEKYNYVLIDEFQDSNSAQLRLAHLVADHYSSDGLPNIMAVGDDDQSIYGFNGAELNNLLYFNRTFTKVETIVLTENYRSSQAILDCADQTIAQCQDRLVTRLPHLSKQLIAKNPPTNASTIIHNIYDDIDQQYSAVANEIHEYNTSNPEKSVAVLARQNNSLVQLASIFNKLGTPISFEKSQNILDLPVIQLIHLIFKTISAINRGDEVSVSAFLSELLPHPVWNIPSETLWQIAKENRYEHTWLEAIKIMPETESIANWLEQLARESTYEPLDILLEKILGIRTMEELEYQSPLKNYYIENSGEEINFEYLKTLSGIRTLRSAVKDASPEDTAEINDWLNYIETMKANSQILSDQSIFLNDGNAVELLTVHKAKGLEFDRVYIIDTQDNIWRPKAETNSPPANLPLRPPLETMDDYTRLMYVAMTRAKQDLIVTSFRFNTKGDEVLSTSLVSHIKSSNIISDTHDAVDTLENSISWPRLSNATEKELLNPILNNFTINATNLINFLDVTNGGTDSFLTKNLLRLPDVKNEQMSHGTAMHYALELGQKLTNKNSFSLQAVIDEYLSKLKKEKLPPNRYDVQAKEGERIIKYLFENLEYQLPKNSMSEKSLQKIQIGEAIIGGKLDRIDIIDENHLRIVDYKTGKPLHSFETKDKIKSIQAWKHKLQLTFYALLAKNHPEFNMFKDIEGQMVYLHAEKPNELTLSYAPTDEDIDRLSRLIQSTWSAIMQYQLPDSSQYEQSIEGIHQFEQYMLDNYKI